MKDHRLLSSYCTALGLAALLLAVPPALANTLHVTAYGVDSSTCGVASPCRSISQAMDNAASGDTIYVGPGKYGDVNGDNFTGPGDEQPGGTNSLFGPAIGCIVCITKPLHIYSVLGAAATTIASDPQSAYAATVLITSGGVDFGGPGQGFTLTGGNQYGVLIVPGFPTLQNISIVGNIDQGDGQGFGLLGQQGLPLCQFVNCTFTARVLIANNQAFGNATGFGITSNSCCSDGHGPIILNGNLAIGASTGFAIMPGSVTLPGATGPGFAENVQIVGNVASGGGIGFNANSTGEIEYNTALNNSQMGFMVNPGGAAFYGNSAIGNGGPGVLVVLQDQNTTDAIPELDTSGFSTFAGNNFIGNDRNRTSVAGPSAHCGLVLGPFLPQGFPLSSPPPLIKLVAANNYWGSASGPTGSGPADTAGGVCDMPSDGVAVMTVVTPFAKTPLAVSTVQ